MFYTAVCVPRSPRRPIGFRSLLSDNVWWVRWYASCQWNCRGHYLINPNKALLWGKSLKITLYLHCLIPPKIGNLMTPALVVAFFMQRLCQNSSEKTWRKEKKKRHVSEIFWWGGQNTTSTRCEEKLTLKICNPKSGTSTLTVKPRVSNDIARRPGPKRKRSSANHPFSGASAVSFKEKNTSCKDSFWKLWHVWIHGAPNKQKAPCVHCLLIWVSSFFTAFKKGFNSSKPMKKFATKNHQQKRDSLHPFKPLTINTNSCGHWRSHDQCIGCRTPEGSCCQCTWT